MEMTPVHLASSIAVLDVLYQYDADVQALDCNRRTPLFIACAMNREECSDFLISMIDHTTGSANKEGEELLYKVIPTSRPLLPLQSVINVWRSFAAVLHSPPSPCSYVT